jgi:formate dehydrogenase-N beta subunit
LIPVLICGRGAKPLSAAGFIATFAGLIYHYIGIGPNKEVDDDEEEHDE